jgi:predicted molibdopterin-dependent oxidoreductase YjgC
MSECVQCGYCCTVRPCAVGEWDSDKKQCRFLTADTKCAKYAEIQELERGAAYPMFGSGCSSSLFNTVREAKVKENAR